MNAGLSAYAEAAQEALTPGLSSRCSDPVWHPRLALPLLVLLMSVALAACGPVRGRSGGGGNGNSVPSSSGSDQDGDGLSDTWEAFIGTDPGLVDTDGDGFDDGEEYLAFFRPWDATDFPYEGGYPRGPIPEEVDGEGYEPGDVSMDWSLPDRFDEILSLHRFYGNVVVVFITAEWDPVGQLAAVEMEDEFSARRDDGLVVLNLLIDGLTQGSEPDLDRRSDTFDLTYPTLNDVAREVSPHYIITTDGSFTIPNFTTLDRELRIVEKYANPLDWDLVDELLAEPLPDGDWPLPE